MNVAPLQWFHQHRSDALNDLKKLVRIPSISFPGFPSKAVTSSAKETARLLKRCGLKKVALLTVQGTHPAVYGERCEKKGAPTLLLYAHHDVQPVGDRSLWKSEPFKPKLAGGRLYGRGTADDKAGIVVHTAAIGSWLKSTGSLPVNVKVIVEGEEETGSPHLGDILRKYRRLLAADILILTDTTNIAAGIPCLTTSLRGMVAVRIEVRALKNAVHSGMWGGLLPDPSAALAKILSSLVNESGKIAIQGIYDDVRELTPAEKKTLSEIPVTQEDLKKEAGLLDGISLLEENPLEVLWHRPSLTVNAMQASSRAEARNIICNSAWARVTLRTVPNMDGEKAFGQLADHLQKNAPWGVKISVERESVNPWWQTNGKGEAFETAISALQKGFVHKAYKIGCGGSIPFVAHFADVMGKIPTLLVGVEDPETFAHAENESLNVADWEKSIRSMIILYEDLATTSLRGISRSGMTKQPS